MTVPAANPDAAVADAPRGDDQSPDRIQKMFEQITPSYDGLNMLFSGMLDRWWRRVMARELTRELTPCARVLDVATGTGDSAKAVVKRVPGVHVVGLDFTGPMLRKASEKYASEQHDWVQGDGLNLPLAGGNFDGCCIAFGLRNMIDRGAALREMHRILRPGGRVAILEFSQPPNPIIRWFYDFYSFTIMPRVGKWISGSVAYLYLPESIRNFLSPEDLTETLESAGFESVHWKRMMFGVVCLHLGEAKK